MHHTVRLQKKEIQRLRDKLDMHISSQGVKVEDPVHNDLVAIMRKHSEGVLTKHGEESFQGGLIVCSLTLSVAKAPFNMFL